MEKKNAHSSERKVVPGYQTILRCLENDKFYSELEKLVMKDMIQNGFNCTSKKHIQTYWKERLE